MMKILLLLTFIIFVIDGQTVWKNPCTASSNANQKFCDTSLSFEERAQDLIYNVENQLPDKLDVWGWLFNVQAQAVTELSIPAYEWGNEALHGVANSYGVNWNGPVKHATMFPMPIATASSFNTQLFYNIGKTISTEARAMFNNGQAGLTFWAPNMNIYRDPRWGRGQETPGEDPFLTATYAKYFVLGMQGSDYSFNKNDIGNSSNKYLKVSACCKHFADYSIEQNRDSFNSIVTDYDQNDTYLVAFKSCITEGDVSGLMCAYDAINGVPSCADYQTQTVLARNEWGFNGYITSDCGAVADVFTQHHYTNSWDETANVVLSAGMDVNCGAVLSDHTAEAVTNGAMNVSTVQKAQYHLALLQMRLGLFDDQSSIPWSKLGPSDVCTSAALSLSLSAARQSIVLLKNNNNVLPINPSKIKGPVQAQGNNAQSENVMWGDYYGSPPFTFSLQDGITNYSSKFTGSQNIVIIGAGLDQSQESELKDRNSLILPSGQDNQINQIASQGKQNGAIVILVIISGGCVDISSQTNNSNIDAILWAGYGGMYGGLAIADVIFGTFAPIGRLTQTWYYESYLNQQSMENMGIRPNKSDAFGNNPGRGYRYYPGNVIYPFGYGLSYTTFKCSPLKQSGNVITTTVSNAGDVDSGAIVLVYFIPSNPGGTNPLKKLIAFGNIEMIKSNGGSQDIQMEIFSQFDTTQSGKYILDGVCA